MHSCKETILKYFTEFTAYINGQDVYVMFNNGGHRLVDSVDDFAEDVKYIILNDSYFTFRKALADGMTLQVNVNYSQSKPDWRDARTKDQTLFSGWQAQYLRIKPDDPKYKIGQLMDVNGTMSRITESRGSGVYLCEFIHKKGHWVLEEAWDCDYNQYNIDDPTFKVGDWIQEKYNTMIDGKTVIKTRTMQITIAEYDVIVCGKVEIRIPCTRVTLWEPQGGDLCWFWNKLVMFSYPQLASFDRMLNGKFDTDMGTFDFCEPFIGSSPTTTQ